MLHWRLGVNMISETDLKNNWRKRNNWRAALKHWQKRLNSAPSPCDGGLLGIWECRGGGLGRVGLG